VPPEPPSKFISNAVTLQTRASVEYVDMDGMHDGQAIKTIIADLQPRKLVLVKSNKASTEALLEFFKSTPSITHDVFYPGTNESVRIGEHVQSFSLQLGDSISALLSGKWSKFEGYEVAMVDGKLAYASGSTVPLLEAPSVELPPMAEVKEEPEAVAEAEAEEAARAKAEAEADAPEAAAEAAEDVAMEEGKPDIVTDEPATAADEETAADEVAVKAEPEIEVEPEAEPEAEVVMVESDKPVGPSGPAPLPGSLFIGDLRLLALKSRLAGQKIDAQFAGEGVLVCGTEGKGSMVVVRKLGEGQVVLEGAVSKTYFAVRKELYGSYAQVTAM
jgi:cleavage and polyadenylation specificity factor subunit 2